MLPGFRFLFAAIVFATSVLIFGLGAAALLRAAHEEFANLPSRRSTPEPMFARRTDETPPTLALLQIDLPEEKPADAAPAPEAIAETPAPAVEAPAVRQVEPEKLAALKPADATPEPVPAEVKPEAPVEAIAPSPAVSTPATDPETSPGTADIKIAAIPETSEPTEADAPPPTAPAPDVTSFEDNAAASRIATLGGPAVIIDPKAASGEPAAATAAAKPDHTAIRKRAAAEKARERRRIAVRRARATREATAAQQQLQAYPFAQLPFPTNPTAREVR